MRNALVGIFLIVAAVLSALGPMPAQQAAQTTGVRPQAGKPQQPENFFQRWLPSDPNETRKAVLASVLTLAGAAVLFFSKQIGRGLRQGAVWAWERLRVERASEVLYRKRIASDLRGVQILRMSEPKNLDDFYVPLQLADWTSADLHSNPQPCSGENHSLASALGKFTRVTILGDPGAGKTTVSSYCSCAIADRRVKIGGKHYFPVYVPLRSLKSVIGEGSDGLLPALEKSLGQYGFRGGQKYLERKLAAGECLLVFDGFDELADKTGDLQLALAQKLKTFSTSIHPDNRIVLTSRPHSYEPAWFSGFQVFELTELTLVQIEQFIDGWFGKGREQWAQALKATVREHERIQLLLTKPLMLAIVCFVYGAQGPTSPLLPNRRVDIYERCVHALITEWDRSRGIDRHSAFNPTEILAVLEQIAYHGLLHEKLEFSRRELLGLIRSFLPKVSRQQYEAESFIEEVIDHTGILKLKAHDVIGFLHRTFHEYFAAKVIESKVLQGVADKDVRGSIRDLLNNLYNPLWTEPIALAAGVMRGRSELISVLHEEYKVSPNDELLGLLGMSLRDADLEAPDRDPEVMLIQDEVFSKLVARAYPKKV